MAAAAAAAAACWWIHRVGSSQGWQQPVCCRSQSCQPSLKPPADLVAPSDVIRIAPAVKAHQYQGLLQSRNGLTPTCLGAADGGGDRGAGAADDSSKACWE